MSIAIHTATKKVHNVGHCRHKHWNTC